MPFKSNIEIGRLAVIDYGERYGEPVLIVDVVDGNRVVVDSPEHTHRELINMKRLRLTPMKITMSRCPGKERLKELLNKNRSSNVFKRFAVSPDLGVKIAKKKRKEERTDFQRFCAMRRKAIPPGTPRKPRQPRKSRRSKPSLRSLLMRRRIKRMDLEKFKSYIEAVRKGKQQKPGGKKQKSGGKKAQKAGGKKQKPKEQAAKAEAQAKE